MRKVTYIGLLSALTYIFTAFIRLPLPLSNNGYIHAGNIVIVMSACLFGPIVGALVGTIGSMFADLFVAPVWVPYTIVIKFLLGYFVGIGYKRGGIAAWLLYIAAGIVVVGGYYMAEVVIGGNWLTPAGSTVQLILEYTVSLIIGLVISKRLASKNLAL